MGDDRPNRYIEGDKTIYRASALGGCLKSLTALALGMSPDSHPEWLLRKFDEGNRGEPVVLSILESSDELPAWKMDQPGDPRHSWHDGQVMVEVPVGESCVIRGHLDGVGQVYAKGTDDESVELGERRMVEVKCTTEDYGETVLRRLPMMYQTQISCYMGWLRLKGLLAIGVKGDDGVVVKVRTKLIDRAPMTMAQVKGRVAEVERRVAEGELGKCDYRQWPCQFPWLCDEEWGGNEGTSDEDIEGALALSIEMAKAKRREREGEG